MNNQQRYWYLDELLSQSLAATVSYDSLIRHLSNQQARNTVLVWSDITAFLAHAGVVSKILFPALADRRDRADEILEALGIDDLPNIRVRSGRDNIEHIDERIDNWAARDANALVSMVFEDRAGYEYICTPEKAVRRALIEPEMAYVSENRNGGRVETPLGAILAELEQVQNLAFNAMQRDPPYHFLLAQALANHAR